MSSAGTLSREFARVYADALDAADDGDRSRLTLLATGHAAIHDAMEQLEARTRRSMVNMQSQWRIDPQQRVAHLDERSRERGIAMSAIVPQRALEISPLLPSLVPDLWIAPVQQDGILIDDALVVLSGRVNEQGLRQFWTSIHPDLVGRLVAIRDALLAQGRRPQEITGREPLSLRQFQVALGIARGDLDAATARRLGVSLRTVEREVAAVLRYLEAKSRHDAALIMVGERRLNG